MKVTVLYSGGLDSRVLVEFAREMGYTPVCYWFNIGQPYAAAERGALPEYVKTRYIDWMRGLAPTHVNPGSLVGPITIPGRNLALAVIAGCMEVAEQVWLGGLASEMIPQSADKNPAFLATASAALTQALWPWCENGVRVRFPLAEMGWNKVDALRWVRSVRQVSDGDLLHTFSCVGEQSGHARHCGRCSSCLRRWGAFKQVGIEQRFTHPIMDCPLHWQMVRALITGDRHGIMRKAELLPAVYAHLDVSSNEGVLDWLTKQETERSERRAQ